MNETTQINNKLIETNNETIDIISKVLDKDPPEKVKLQCLVVLKTVTDTNRKLRAEIQKIKEDI